MVIERLQASAHFPSPAEFGGPVGRTAASYERELSEHRHTEARLREALCADEALLRQKDELLRHREVLSKESDHRLLNGLQMIVSLLSLQSRRSANAETASQLAVAANRVAMVERVHRRLHSFDGAQTVAFKKYIEDLCRDFAAMLASDDRPDEGIVVDGVEVNLPAVTVIPLGFIVNELITNAVKYGKGPITVSLKSNLGEGYALSVTNTGPSLPDGFDPAAREGLGMKIVRSFVKQIGGELQFGPGPNNQGAQFTVLFS